VAEVSPGTRWAWLTDHWRLKLLSAILAVIMFGTVAFAQNPITVRTVHVRISSYQITDQQLVLIEFPTHVDVHAVGLADAVDPLTPDDVAAAMDLSKVAAPSGPPQKIQVAVNVRTVAPGVTLQETSVPVLVTVDSLNTASIPIQVADQPAPGVSVTKVAIDRHGSTDPVSSVSVTGPTSLLDGLKALVDLGTIEGGTEFLGAPLKFQDKTGKTIKWPPATIPLGSVDISSVDVTVTAHQTQQQKQVAPAATITGSPACGYSLAGISINPSLVTLTGDVPSLTAAGESIALTAVDITGATSNITSRQKLTAPTGTTVNPSTVTVTVSIKQVAACTPASPLPASPTPQPTPT
jgi:YbbR domain-containing protein